MSGNNRNFLQATGTARPTLVSSSPINSMPSVQFDGTDDFMEQAVLRNIGAQLTCFAVVRYTATGRAFLFCGDSDTMSIELGQGFYETWDGTNYTNWETTGVAINTNYGYVMRRSTPAASTLTRNGSSMVFRDSLGSAFDSSFNIFSLGRRTGVAGFFWRGYISEAILYNRALTPTEITGIRNYLIAKWGVG